MHFEKKNLNIEPAKVIKSESIGQKNTAQTLELQRLKKETKADIKMNNQGSFLASECEVILRTHLAHQFELLTEKCRTNVFTQQHFI